MNFQSAGSSSYRPQSFRRIVSMTALRQTSGMAVPEDTDELVKLKAGLDFCADHRPDQLLAVTSGGKESYASPLLMIGMLAHDEFCERAKRGKGHNPHRYEPVDAIAAMEKALQKGIPEELQILPYPLLENIAKTGSTSFFELPLKYGVRQDPEKTRDYLKAIKKEALTNGTRSIQEYRDLEELARNTKENQQTHADAWKQFESLRTQFNITNPQAELDRAWTPEGIRTFNERLLSGLNRMDLLSRSYERVHEFIYKLHERVRETRANRLIAEDMAEKQKAATPSKSAKKKARQKAAKAQRAALKQEQQEIRQNVSPAERPQSSASPSVGSARSAQPSREKAPAASTAPTWTDFSSFLHQLSEQPAERAPLSSFSPKLRQQLRQAEDLMKARWTAAMQEAARPDSDTVIYSSEKP